MSLVAGMSVLVGRPACAQTGDENRFLNQFHSHYKAGQYAKAIESAERHLELMATRYGHDRPPYAYALNNLALAYDRQGKFAKAEPLYLRSLAIKERTLAPTDPSFGTSYNNLASLYERMGRYSEAEPHYKRALAFEEKAHGPSHSGVAIVLSNLAELYVKQKRFDEAGQLHKRALSIKEKTLGGNHPSVGVSYNNLATLYERRGLLKAAEPLYKRAIEIWNTSLGSSHIKVAAALANLAGMYVTQGRFAEAEPNLKRTLQIYETTLGSRHPLVGLTYANLGRLKDRQRRYDEAEMLYERALANLEKTRGPDHPQVATIVHNLSFVDMYQEQWASAYDRIRRVTQIHASRALKGLDQYRSGSGRTQSSYFFNEVAVAGRLEMRDAGRREELKAASFIAAQWAGRTSAAAALRQMATRLGSNDPKLAKAVRERQDLARRWQVLDGQLIKAISASKAARDNEAIDRLRARLEVTDRRIRAVSARLDKDFPDYAALSNPRPLTTADVQKLVREDEAVILFLVGEREFFVWAVTRDTVVWKAFSLERDKIAEAIQVLRKSLDPIAALQSGNRGFTRAEACKELVRSGKSCESYDTDLERAHRIYTGLLGPIEKTIRNKRQLTIVPSGPLTGLPFHMLVTAPPPAIQDRDQRLRRTQWLIRRHSVTVLPSISSLSALRVLARKGRAEKPFIGFGDPDFVKPEDRAKKRKSVKTAQAMRGYAAYFRGALANVDELSGAIAPLPDSAEELRAVAKSLKAPTSDILLGRSASETKVKALSREGRLDDYRVVHFATHGLISGEIEGLGEPALALSLPSKATKEDDGLLTASEVAQLKLNADWVVLSACNTAAGEKPGAEAFSGLARAFFYSGTRALLVSHWPVVSEAAVKLTTGAFDALRTDPAIGRAEALRRAMLDLIDNGDPNERHPAYWAPFVLVGEGAG